MSKEFKMGQKFTFKGVGCVPDSIAEIIGFTKTQVKFIVISGYDGRKYNQSAKLRKNEEGQYITPYNRFTIRPSDEIK
ncbi:MAG TPA: hypothetical protein GXZ90_02895 [Clostridiales bacterium]|nr:hypothetical protein [Clostridiales bacterium]